MRKNSNKALYESIMRKVSNVVKKELNESETGTPDFVDRALGYLYDFLSDNGVDIDMMNMNTAEDYGELENIVKAIYSLEDRF